MSKTSVQDVLDVLNKFYGDTSRSKRDTSDGLKEIRDETQQLLDLNNDEIEREEKEA